MEFWKCVIWEKCPDPNFQIPRKQLFFERSQISRYLHLASCMNVSHIREGRSQKVNMEEPHLTFFHGNFHPVISHAVRKPCQRGDVQVSPLPLSSRRLDAKRHYVIWAKALDGIWPVGHACAVLCRGTAAVPQHSTAQAWPTGQIPCSALAQMT